MSIKIKIDSTELYNAIEGLWRCADSVDAYHPHLQNILFRFTKQTFRAYATNGHILFVYAKRCFRNVTENKGVIEFLVPIRKAKLLKAMLRDSIRDYPFDIELLHDVKNSILSVDLNEARGGVFSFYLTDDCDFPRTAKMHSLIPKFGTPVDVPGSRGCIGLSGKYLKMIADSFRSISTSKMFNPIVVEPHGNKSDSSFEPTVFTSDNPKELLAILMPVRIDVPEEVRKELEKDE